MRKDAKKVRKEQSDQKYFKLAEGDYFERFSLDSDTEPYEEKDMRGAENLGIPPSKCCEAFCSKEFCNELRPDGRFYGDPFSLSNSLEKDEEDVMFISLEDLDGEEISFLQTHGFSIIENEDQFKEAGFTDTIELYERTGISDTVDEAQNAEHDIFSPSSDISLQSVSSEYPVRNLGIAIHNLTKINGKKISIVPNINVILEKELSNYLQKSHNKKPLKRRKIASTREDFSEIKNQKTRKRLKKNKRNYTTIALKRAAEKKQLELDRKKATKRKKLNTFLAYRLE